MVDNNVNNFLEENKSHVYLKIETEGDDIREEIEDNAIRIISFQRKSLKVHAKKDERKVELCTEGG